MSRQKICRAHIYLTADGACGNDAKEKRGNSTGVNENAIVYALHTIFNSVVISKNKGCPPRDNSQQHGRQRNMDKNGHGCINFRKANKQNNNGYDKPHVVCLPNGTDNTIHGMPCLAFMLALAY